MISERAFKLLWLAMVLFAVFMLGAAYGAHDIAHRMADEIDARFTCEEKAK